MNIAIAVLCLDFLVGYGDKESPAVLAKPEAGQSYANKVEETKLETAIYFPDCAGVDFGVNSISKKKCEDKTSKLRALKYLLNYN